MNRRSLVAAALATYPRWWRDRYGEEMAALCDDLRAEGRPPARLVLSLCAGAATARIRGTGIPSVASVHQARARAALAADAMAMLAAVPLLVWASMTTGDREASVGGRWHTIPHVGRVLTRQRPGFSVAGEMALWAKLALLVLAAALVVQLVGAWGAARPAGRRRWSALRWAPGACTLAALGAAAVRGHYLPEGLSTHGNAAGAVTVLYRPGAHPDLAAAFAVVTWVAVGLVVVSSALLVVLAARSRAEPTCLPRAGRIGRRLSVTGTLAALSATVWAAGVALQSPPPAHGSYAVVTSSLRPWAGPLASAVLVLAVLAWVGAAQARKSLQVVDRLPAGSTPSASHPAFPPSGT